jgi:hypothetical protein
LVGNTAGAWWGFSALFGSYEGGLQMKKERVFSFKELKLPWLYQKALKIFEESDLEEFTKKDLTALFNRRFRLSKEDVALLIKEFTEMGILEKAKKKFQLM